MKSFRTAAVASIAAIALIGALWWALTPQRHNPDMAPLPQASAPASAAAAAAAPAPPEIQPDTRHVTTVDLRRR